MDYSELLGRCRRALNLAPESDVSLTDCVALLQQFPGGIVRHVASEKLAHEMAEWIEQTTVHPTRGDAKKAH